MRNFKRGQTSIEFAFLLGFMFLLFLVFFKIVQERVIDAEYVYDRENLKEIKNLMINEIRNADGFGVGYERNFSLPRSINGKNYSVEIWETNELIIKVMSQEFIDFLDVNITGNSTTVGSIEVLVLNKGDNIICKETVGSVDQVIINQCS